MVIERPAIGLGVVNESMLGYFVCAGSSTAVAQAIIDEMKNTNVCRYLVCFNPHSYALGKRSPQFSEAMNSASWLIPDGVGIVLASKLLTGCIQRRLTGSDIFFEMSRRVNDSGGYSVFFLGTSDESLAAIRDKFQRDYPNVRIAGLYSPPYKADFNSSEIEDMIERINRASPDILWVGMSSPKQDIFIYSTFSRLNVKFAAGIGAVFDFYIGRVPRTHPFLRNIGFEWLPRLLREPRRLWRRTFISAPIFLFDLLVSLFTRKADLGARRAQ